ncbi:helix-turn-helix domain-containing protein [Bradyrhizobium sp. SZCCHNS3051]|uniref:helix-turn-helix domain-containing protein n=1 Tax=Bradyrhizobium sp. SZCCHNS3051 TaxID=3057320 RepID=UPI00291679C2|nr:helix-turn-helix domain-containing protein [Bradyrhizobium sp. SZCCHNS3051]
MTQTSTRPSQPSAQRTENLLAAEHGLARFRDATAEIAEIKLLGAPDQFQVRASTWHLGSAVAIDATSTPMIHDRTALHVARSGVDSFQIVLYPHGSCEYTVGRRSVTQASGDICLIDMGAPSRSTPRQAADGSYPRGLSLIVPRSALAPLLAAPDSVQAPIISSRSDAGRLAREHMLALVRPQGVADVDQSVQDLLGVIARCLGPAAGTDMQLAAASRQILLSAIKRYIHEHLHGHEVEATHLCRQFRLSRATLYRLFEFEGGLAEYVQQQRLMRALALLTAPGERRPRMSEIARTSSFASNATFTRAFRRLFGITPTDARALATAHEKARAARNGPATPTDMYLWEWLRAFRNASP